MKTFPLLLRHPGRLLAFACAALALLPALPIRANGLIIVDQPADLTVIFPPPHPHPPRPPHPPHPPWPPRPMPPRPIHRHMPLDLERQQVEIAIRDQVATTEVLQVFKNSTSRRFEGTFIFPVPANAHINEFAMEVNGELVEAELLDEKKARKIYEDIVRRARDPALFEYAGRKLFKVRIFPIEPHSTKEVRVRYSELLRKDGDILRYTYPLNTSKYCLKPIPDFSMKIVVETGEDRILKTVYSPSHEVEVSRKGKRRAVLGLEAHKLDPTADFQLYLSHKRKGGDPVDVDFLTYHENGANDPGHFMLLISPAAWEEDAKPMPKDVIFVFDSSGSMRGEKMEQAQAAMRFCIESLNREDRFEVIRFSTEAEPVFEDLVDAGEANREKALKFVKGVRAIGGTAIEEALGLAMKTAARQAKDGRPTQILFLTDGKPTLGATKEDDILRSMDKAKGDVDATIRVFCFGIGSSINTHLLDLTAERTRAVSEYVLPDEDIEEKVSRFFAKISDPVLTDLDLDIDGVDWIRNRYPKDLPDVFRGDQVVVFGRYQPDGKRGDVVLRGSIRGKKSAFEIPVTFGSEDEDHEFIANLWATRRVGYLLDQIRLHGESSELKDEVAQLARKYGIVTPYTSYLIVEDEERRNVPEPLRTQTRATRPSISTGAVRGFDGRETAAPSADAFADAFESIRSEKSGEDAVAGAAATKRLKESTASSGVRDANLEADRARGRSIALVPSQRLAGKTFYQKAEFWIDESAQDLAKDANRRTIQFASPEYFDLLTQHKHLAQWLSVGPQVQIVIDGELIEIVN